MRHPETCHSLHLKYIRHLPLIVMSLIDRVKQYISTTTETFDVCYPRNNITKNVISYIYNIYNWVRLFVMQIIKP
jgi:hypothetical protein